MSEGPSRVPKVYRGFGDRLHHGVPAWVREDAIFHIRVRVAAASRPLTEPALATLLLDSVKLYQTRERWWVHLFLLMPDHWHALLTFGRQHSMSKTLADWKGYHARKNGVVWQENFFDHRLRNHLAELDAKDAYIRANPIVKGWCAMADDWPWQWSACDIAPDPRPE